MLGGFFLFFSGCTFIFRCFFLFVCLVPTGVSLCLFYIFDIRRNFEYLFTSYNKNG